MALEAERGGGLSYSLEEYGKWIFALKDNIKFFPRYLAIAMATLLVGCTSTVAFRASPASLSTARLTCLQFSSGACAFNIDDETVKKYGVNHISVGKASSLPFQAQVRWLKAAWPIWHFHCAALCTFVFMRNCNHEVS
jgi:hypothetical protein